MRQQSPEELPRLLRPVPRLHQVAVPQQSLLVEGYKQPLTTSQQESTTPQEMLLRKVRTEAEAAWLVATDT
tara:strand:- start:95 stop:307 length:213 start_codon:yes stop_codon:yes gene_type:complete